MRTHNWYVNTLADHTHIKGDRTGGEDLLSQALLDWGVDLTQPIRPETMTFADRGGLP